MSGGPVNVSDALGQIVWLFSQSPIHKHLKIADLEWSVMPVILSEQFRIFRFGPLPGLEDVDPSTLLPGVTVQGLEQMPLGVAFWANLSEAVEEKLERGERLEAADWNSGDRLWLVELISPFATPENKLTEIMLADLIGGPFKGKGFSLHKTDVQTGVKYRLTIPAPEPTAA